MNKQNTVLVCVTAQSSSENLISTGKAIAQKHSAGLEVVTVIPIEKDYREFDPLILDNLHTAAKKHGGELAVYFSDDPTMTVCAHIAKRKPLTLVLGFPGEKSNNFVSLIHLLLPDIPISMVDTSGTVYNILPNEATPIKI